MRIYTIINTEYIGGLTYGKKAYQNLRKGGFHKRIQPAPPSLKQYNTIVYPIVVSITFVCQLHLFANACTAKYTVDCSHFLWGHYP